MKKYSSSLIILSSLIFMGGLPAFAQNTGDAELDIVEMELEKNPPPKSSYEAPVESSSAAKPRQEEALTDFSGLGKLAPFSEVSVIQKRFMPKTERFQFFLGPAIVTNDPFFSTYGGEVKLGYFFSETWGVELNYFFLTTSEKDATKELRAINGVSTVNLVYPKSYLGGDIMFVPVYGKMAWFNKKIVPFDLYFSAGYGTTDTQSGEKAGTVHVATGQIFSLSKSFALRWDFSWNFYNAKGIDEKSKASANNLFLSVGMSFFFPEANYR